MVLKALINASRYTFLVSLSVTAIKLATVQIRKILLIGYAICVGSKY
jgi:hypothetical protein